jgi:ElaB/YqjD/DUF883 family membrane-anchored ribosome-binding protein
MLKTLSIVIGTAALGATLFAGRQVSRSSDGRIERTSDSSVSCEGAKNLKIQLPVASLVLDTTNNERLSVHAVRWTKDPESEAGKKWMRSSLNVTHDGDHLNVTDSSDGDHSVTGLKGHFNGGLDIHISIPRGLNVQLNQGVGETKTNGDYRSIDLGLGAGHVVGKFRLTGTDNSMVRVGAGQIELDLPRGSNLDVTTNAGVGEITGIPGRSKPATGIHLGDKRAARLGSGGTSLSVHVGAGSIVIHSDADVHALAMTETDALKADQAFQELHLDPDMNGSMDNLGAQIEAATAHIEPDVNEALEKAMPEVDRELAEVGPEVERALKEAQPEIDKALAEVGPQVDEALRKAKPEMDRELANIGPEIRRAMKEAQREMQKGRKEREKALREARPEIEKAMKEAQKALDDATRELDKSGLGHGEMSDSIRKTVAEALKAARSAMRESMKEARKAIEDAKKDGKSDVDHD